MNRCAGYLFGGDKSSSTVKDRKENLLVQVPKICIFKSLTHLSPFEMDGEQRQRAPQRLERIKGVSFLEHSDQKPW